MDKKTRVLNAFDQKPVDRVPVSFWYHYSGATAQGETCVQAHMDTFRTSGVDYIKIMSDGFMGQCPYGPVTKASDWATIQPLADDHPFFALQLERARRVNEELKGECLTFYNVFAPFSLMRWAGEDMVMAQLLEDEASVLAGLAIIAQDTAKLCQKLIQESGCTGIYFALQGAEIDRFTIEQYQRIVRPSDLMVINAANACSSYNIAHLCGWAGIPNHLEDWRDYPVKAVNWAVFVEGVDLVAGKRFFGPDKCVIGGFDNRKTGLLYKNGTKEEVQAFTKKLVNDYVAAFSSNQGLIIGADCTLAADVDPERFQWVVEALSTL